MVSLEKVIVEKCPKIMSIPMEQQEEEEGNDEIGFPLKPRYVELVDCGDKFIQFLVNGLMTRLSDGANCVGDYLVIRSCDSIQHLEIANTRGGNKLKGLTINDCRNLVSLCNSEPGISNVEIEELMISHCPSLTIDGMKLLVAAAVQRIWIQNCNQLDSAAWESIMSSTSTLVTHINICKCTNLKRLPDSLHSLTSMWLCHCQNLRSLPDSLHSLTSLWLCHCHGLECFPENGLPIPTLNYLEITYCRNLKSLPKNMHCLTSLKTLKMRSCPGVKFLTEEEGSLPPPNLIDLTIKDCSNLKQSMSMWGFHTLTSLQELSIGGVPQLPEDEPTLTTTLQLPTTLRTLQIGEFKNVESITFSSWGIQNLVSLRSLELRDCPKLRYLPKELPPTLEVLEIRGCPILLEKYREGKIQQWDLISLIPKVTIDGSYSFAGLIALAMNSEPFCICDSMVLGWSTYYC